MSKYKNTTEHELMIAGVGVVEAGGTIETDQLLESPNLELVEATGPVEGEIVSHTSPAAPTITAPVAPAQITAASQENK